MGQRMVVLQSSYTGYGNNTAVLHVSQMPPNAAVMVPGPALAFVVVQGIPSIGAEVMIGSGAIELQAMLPVGAIPVSSIVQNDTSVALAPDAPSTSDGPSAKSAAYSCVSDLGDHWLSIILVLLATWAVHV